MPETLEDKLAKIERGEQQIVQIFQQGLRSNSNMYLTDFLMVGVAKRTVSLADGFRTLITAHNFICAAALVRMQLDTAFRLFAATLTNSPEKYAHDVFHGKRIDRLKDRNGNHMTDSYLAKKLNEQFPWVLNVYEQTSELVHFTNRHIFASATKLDEDTRTVHFLISAKDPPRPNQDYFEVVDCFYEAMRITATIAAGWVQMKKIAA